MFNLFFRLAALKKNWKEYSVTTQWISEPVYFNNRLLKQYGVATQWISELVQINKLKDCNRKQIYMYKACLLQYSLN